LYEHETLQHFLDAGLISAVERPLKSGKEASVWMCRGTDLAGAPLVAAKIYRPIAHRGFRNDAVYAAGRSFGKERENRAVRTKTRFGREVQERAWTAAEFSALTKLHEAGADVPRPIAPAEHGLLMELVGDEEGPAPQLHRVRLSRHEAEAAFDQVVWNLRRLLHCRLVHADLSPFNLLWWRERVVVIDLPQAVDALTNPNAEELLRRDVTTTCRWFEKLGVARAGDPDELADGLWVEFQFAEL
jgi:RIO kinase 1